MHVPSGVLVPGRRHVVDGALGPVEVPVVPLLQLPHLALEEAAALVAGRPAPGDLQDIERFIRILGDIIIVY